MSLDPEMENMIVLTVEQMTREYNHTISSAVSKGKKLPAVPLSAVEVLTYFPHHLQHPEVMFRLLRAGFRSPTLAKAQINARRGRISRQRFTRRNDALRHAIITAGRKKCNDEKFTLSKYAGTPVLRPLAQTNGQNTNHSDHYDGSEMEIPLKDIERRPATLRDVANGVVNHPTRDDAGILTQAINWARANGQLANYTTDDVDDLARQHNFTTPLIGHAHNWDQDCLSRVEQLQVV